MLNVFGRGLVLGSRFDPVVKEELLPLPSGFVFEIAVLPSGPRLRVRKGEHGRLELDDGTERASVSVQLKHLRHALRLLTFVEPTMRALAQDRIVIDGEVAHAMRMQRVLDRVQSRMLPSPLAKLALRRI
jgi:hypothetical protein